MTDWISNCEICNTGLCVRFDEELKNGKKQIQVARDLEKESNGTIKTKVILNHYRYYKGKDDPNKKKSYNKKSAEIVANVRRSKKSQKHTQVEANWDSIIETMLQLDAMIQRIGGAPPDTNTKEKLFEAYRQIATSLRL